MTGRQRPDDEAGDQGGGGSAGALRLGLGIGLVVLLFDQLTKWGILLDVMDPPRVIPVTGFFNLVLVWNYGVSFGMFNTGSPWNAVILTAVAVIVAGSLTWWLRSIPGRWAQGALGLIIGGALGNAVDRVIHGAVVDFVDLHVSGYHWPAFNVADAAISIGALILVIDAVRTRAPEENGPGR